MYIKKKARAFFGWWGVADSAETGENSFNGGMGRGRPLEEQEGQSARAFSETPDVGARWATVAGPRTAAEAIFHNVVDLSNISFFIVWFFSAKNNSGIFLLFSWNMAYQDAATVKRINRSTYSTTLAFHNELPKVIRA